MDRLPAALRSLAKERAMRLLAQVEASDTRAGYDADRQQDAAMVERLHNELAAAEKFAAGLELNLAAVIQRAEAAEAQLDMLREAHRVDRRAARRSSAPKS